MQSVDPAFWRLLVRTVDLPATHCSDMPKENNPHRANRLIRVARGIEAPDLVLSNCRLLNVFTGEVECGHLAIADGHIAGISQEYAGPETIDCKGLLVTPGLIDAHVHIESSLCTPLHFSRTVSARGVTTVMADPHEIANVAGMDGIRYMHACSQGLNLDVKFMAPSCVPASHLETSGADLDAEDLRDLHAEGLVWGLAEMMNYPGVLSQDPKCLSILQAFSDARVDGHAPHLSGLDLNAYLTTGIGSDHECTNPEEALEKLAKGMYILIREGTITRDLDALLPLVNDRNMRRFCFCTDDRIPADLLGEGSVDYLLRRAVGQGMALADAFCLATLNTCEWFGLTDRGAIAPGRRADLVVWDEANNLAPVCVLTKGIPVLKEGQPQEQAALPAVLLPQSVAHSMHGHWDHVNFDVAAPGTQATVRVIGSIENQIVTEHLQHTLPVQNGRVQADPTADVLKISMIERHGRNGSMCNAFISGFGLQRGALAGTIAHDHHNLVVIGADDASMHRAVQAVAGMGGGIAICNGDKVLAQMPLPVAGLMSEAPLPEVHEQYRELQQASADLGGQMHDPLMALSFMGLEVVPSLKITDQGLVDVDAFEFIPVVV